MIVTETRIRGLVIAESIAHSDHRGTFLRCFCLSSLKHVLLDRQVMQINQSRTDAVGAVRGLHFQLPPFAEMKLVRCLRGKVWDVAVDLRQDSPTFLKWHAEVLSPSNNRMMVIPEGFAHGFQVLEPLSELLYLHTAVYSAKHEGGLRYDDPRVNIEWPIQIEDLSQRDRNHPLLDKGYVGIPIDG